MSPETRAEAEPDPGAELQPGERASVWFLVVVAVLSCAADLATKAWAHARLAGIDAKRGGVKALTVFETHIKGLDLHLDLLFAQNPGGAWSFLRGLPDGLRRPFFLFVSAAAIVFIVSIYRRVHRDQTAMKWGLPLALGGAIGNLVDRIRHGWVVDFIDMYVVRGGREHHWPTFNVADIAIVVGVALMGIDMIAASRRARAGRIDSPSAAPTPLDAPETSERGVPTPVDVAPVPSADPLPLPGEAATTGAAGEFVVQEPAPHDRRPESAS